MTPGTSRRRWLQAGALACCAALAPPVRSTDARASFYDGFKGMQLLDQSGRPLSVEALRGKVVLFNFVFTACSTVCPVQTHALVQLQRGLVPALRARVHLVSVSLDALGDTPRTLKAFAARHGVDHANWSFVTGRPDDVYRLAEALWLFRDGKGRGPLEQHDTSLWLVDAQGVLRARYAGNPPDVTRLARELGSLAQDIG